jgi:hypothetical protein
MVRKGNDGNDYQGVKYKVAKATTEAPKAPVAEEPSKDIALEDDPFSDDLPTDTEVEW